MNPRVEADTRWSRELEDAVRAEHVKQLTILWPQPNTSYQENVSLVSVYRVQPSHLEP